MTSVSVRAIPCPCQARSGEPCTPLGDHLARYVSAETAGVISRDCLNAAITKLMSFRTQMSRVLLCSSRLYGLP